MFGGKTREEWIAQYESAHQHSLNRLCHTLGIPMIVVSIVLAIPAAFMGRFWMLPVALFVTGWGLQFLGHAIEGKPPEFLRDWRFLFIGVRWWVAKVRGQV